jgi:hypothetical protein
VSILTLGDLPQLFGRNIRQQRPRQPIAFLLGEGVGKLVEEGRVELHVGGARPLSWGKLPEVDAVCPAKVFEVES